MVRMWTLGSVCLALACGGGGAGADDDGMASPDATPGTSTADAAPNPGADAAPSPGADAAPIGGDPADDGPHDVFVSDGVSIPGADGRAVTATLCAASNDGGSSVAAGPLPLAILSPGFQMDRAQYTSYCEHLASWGFAVVLQTYSESGFAIDHEHLAEDVGAIIDWALAGDGALADAVDPARIGAAGHSLGGKISILAAVLDDRIGAVVGWDPVDANAPSVTPELMGELSAPLAVLGETLDGSGPGMACAPADQNYAQYYDAAGSPALEVTVTGADHMDWVDDPSCFLCSFCRQGSASDADVRALSRRVTAAFLLRHLSGAAGMETYLTGAEMQAEVTAGRATIRSK